MEHCEGEKQTIRDAETLSSVMDKILESNFPATKQYNTMVQIGSNKISPCKDLSLTCSLSPSTFFVVENCVVMDVNQIKMDERSIKIFK